MPDINDLGPQWDVAQANIIGQGPEASMIAGLAMLSGFATIGIGAFFTIAAVETGEALSISYVIGGSTVFCGGTALTEGQAVILELVIAGSLDGEFVAVSQILASWGMELFTMEGLIALALYEPPSPFQQNYGNFGGFLGGLVHYGPGPGGSGITTPPGFPGFAAVTGIGGGWGGLVCIEVNGAEFCYHVY